MTEIKLKPQPVTEKIFQELAEKELILPLKAPASVFREETHDDDALAILYQSQPEFGGHKLICVQKNVTQIQLVYHPDIEEFILLDPTETKFKPLYLAIGLEKKDVLESKAKDGSLSEKDVMLLEMPYNHPRLSYFSMLPNTPHCEVTAPGGGMGPVFFVTEPSQLTQYDVDLAGWSINFS